MAKKSIPVVEKSRLHVSDKGIQVICEMSDGSTWSCDEFGQNWWKEKLNHAELSEAFKNSMIKDEDNG